MKALEHLIIIIVDFLCRITPATKPTSSELEKVKVIAHRGGAEECGFKENTTKVFDYCAQNNIFAIEFDIQWTKDLVPIVHHDLTTKRIFGKNINIALTNFSELRKEVPEIPTLTEVVNSYSSKIHFFIEIKKESFKRLSEENKKQAVQRLQKELTSLSPGEHYHLICLDTYMFNYIDFCPKEFMGTIAILNTREIFEQTLKGEFGAMTGSYFLIGNSKVKALAKKGIQVGLGFITSKNCLFRQINRGCYWIFTNHPKRISKYTQDLTIPKNI